MVTAQQAEDVTARCVAAEPHRGATWPGDREERREPR